MMKYIISESKLHSLIYDYLTSSFQPDYDWGPELHDFYRKDIAEYGYYDFMIDDGSAFDYVGETKSLRVKPWVYERLDYLFGNIWKSVFVEWFKDNSGLPVSNFVKLPNRSKV